MAAREDYADKAVVEYFDVLASKQQLDRMMKYSRGKRQVPVIVEDEKVTIGYGGS
jgi:glutaredoxin